MLDSTGFSSEVNIERLSSCTILKWLFYAKVRIYGGLMFCLNSLQIVTKRNHSEQISDKLGTNIATRKWLFDYLYLIHFFREFFYRSVSVHIFFYVFS